ncbi:COR domain-containing protein [Methylomicrobium lacus]|uniref:COR domain-containing protein n=1 Tax=Methylomicrobium lacus TaxID=136992 RepID=UPI0035A9087F
MIAALEGKSVVEGQGDMTPGIEIRELSIEGSDIKAHFWDFGGQVMAHATHQFFLRERCLYVVVLNARSEINSTEQAEYWLEHVKAFGKSAPVMLVGNKCDQADVQLDLSYLTEKYPNIVRFYPVSCTQAQTKQKAKFESFKQDFCDELAKVGTHQMQFTQAQFEVLEELRQYAPGKAFLKHREFEDICAKHSVSKEGPQNRTWLLDILDKLGVVIHFPQLPCLEDYVLNPRWLTYGVYTLVYAQQSRLTESDVVQILSREKVTDNAGNQLDYPKEKCRFIMDAMQQFKLCYTLPYDRTTLIIPTLLPSDFDRTRLPFQKQGAVEFEFVFRGFLPRNIMPELIVNRHEEIDREMVWQHGVLLKSKYENAQTLIEVDYHHRVLSLWFQGEGRKEYLGIMRDEVLKILGRLELDYSEWIGLPVGALINPTTGLFKEEKAPYRQIVAHAKNGAHEFISESGCKYDLQKIIGVIIPQSELKNIFNINELNVFGGDMKKETTTVIAQQGAQVQQFVKANGNTATQSQTTLEEKQESRLFKSPYFYLGLAAFVYFMMVLWAAYNLQQQGQLGNKTFKEIVLAPIQLLKIDEKK